MKKFPQWSVISWIPGILFVAVSLTSCQKADPQMNNSSEQMSEQMKQDIALISSLGYDIADIEKTDDGYLADRRMARKGRTTAADPPDTTQ